MVSEIAQMYRLSQLRPGHAHSKAEISAPHRDDTGVSLLAELTQVERSELGTNG